MQQSFKPEPEAFDLSIPKKSVGRPEPYFILVNEPSQFLVLCTTQDEQN